MGTILIAVVCGVAAGMVIMWWIDKPLINTLWSFLKEEGCDE